MPDYEWNTKLSGGLFSLATTRGNDVMVSKFSYLTVEMVMSNLMLNTFGFKYLISSLHIKKKSHWIKLGIQYEIYTINIITPRQRWGME